jgi:radical SAM protein with 4Fe4S-binding SPASM domain
MGKLGDRLRLAAIAERLPDGVMIELTYRCNYRCPFCYVDHGAAPKELNLSDWLRILEEMREAGTTHVTLTGGEPLLYRDCLRVLRRAKELGFLTAFFSNGSLINLAVAEELIAIRPGIISFTVYGAEAGSYEAYTGRPGSFKCFLNAVEMLQSGGCEIELKWNATPELVGQMESLIALAESLKVKWRSNGVISPRRDGDCPARVSDEQLSSFYRAVIERSDTLEKNLVTAEELVTGIERGKAPDSLVCLAAVSNCRISPEGRVFPCVDINEPIGDLTQRPFGELWRDEARWERFLSWRLTDFPQCRDCRYAGICSNLCPGQFKEETGSYFTCAREICRNTRAYLQAMSEYMDDQVGSESNILGREREARAWTT